MTPGQLTSVEVPGGTLVAEVITGVTEPVLALHGVSSQRMLWNWLRDVAPDVSLIAPDLRGRGDSVGVRGPSSMARHAADMIALLDALGLGAVPVCGMSMGAFAAVELAASHPARVKSLVLIDGGFPMPVPPGFTRPDLPVLIRDRLARLDRRFESVHEYARFFVSQTAPLLDPDDPLLLAYLAHDLADGRVRLSADALVDDTADIFFGSPRWQQVAVPARLVTAQWSTGRDSPPAYSAAAVQGFRSGLPALRTVVSVAGVDHAASIMTATGARAAAELIAEALA